MKELQVEDEIDTLIPQLDKLLTWDRYAYGNNNPIKNTDPSGHCSLSPNLSTPWGFLGFYGSCYQDINDMYQSYQNGERNIGSLYLEATGIKDAVVDTAEDIHKFNEEFSTVFSDKPLQERIGPAIRLGFNAVITSAIIIATRKSIYARTANTGKLSPSQVYCRYCSIAEGDAITNTGYLRGGRPENTFFSTDQYYSVTEAQESLALPYPPEIKLDFKIQNSPKVIGPKVVAPNFGQPGGGIEYWSSDLIQVVIISVMDLLK